MSLLNDMLRDLSHQQKATETTVATTQTELDFNAQEQRELFYHTSTVKPLPRTLVPSLLVFTLVLAILMLWKFNFFTQSDTGIATAPAFVKHNHNQDVVTESAIKAQEEPMPVAMAESAPDVQLVADNLVEPQLGERIAALESAITNLSVVVANASNHSGNEIVGSTEEAEYEISASAAEEQVEEQFPSTEQASALIIEEVPSSVSIQEPFITAAVDEGEPTLSVAPNPGWKDQQQAQQARQFVAQGQSDIAIEQLQTFIATADQPRESVKTLLEIFIGQENVTGTQSLLEKANYFSNVEKNFYAAKIAVIQQQDAQAIQLLETHLGDAERDENYRSLLAGLYQRTGMHLEAANHYRRLLSVFGDKPAYWLGFALSQDALNQSQVAAQAYQRVNQYADLQPQVRTYVQQRIAALQQ